MKTIRIKRLCLSYFKGIRQASYNFGGNITTVKGCNGSGKSTIVDAISWVLFGVNKEGNTKFGIKTRDCEGETIQDITNSATLTISVNGEDFTLERSLRGNSKTNGGVKNEYTYKVNGEIQTAGDYSRFVDNICPMPVWKMCSTPLFFVSQDWLEQRQMLTSIFGEPDAATISGGDKRFDYIVEELKKSSLEKITKHLNYLRKEILSRLSEIPTRIEELNKVLPQRDDWDNIELALNEELSKHDELIKNLHYVEAGQGATVEVAQKRKKLDFAYKRKTEMEVGATIKSNQLSIEYGKKRQSLMEDMNKQKDTLSALVDKDSSYNNIFKRYEQRKQELESEKLDGAAQWSLLSQKKWKWNEESSYCPTCGQMLPTDQVEELKKSSQEKFLKELAEEKKNLAEKATRIKENLTLCEKEFAEAKEDEQKNRKQIDATQKVIEAIKREKITLDKEIVPSKEDILASNPSYKMVVDQITTLENEETNVDDTLVNDIKSQIDEVKKHIKELQDRQYTKIQYDNISKQIDTIEQQRKVLQEQLDEIDEKIVNTAAYQRRACEVLENIVSNNFSLVKWSMFKRQVDGTDKPWCECSVDGVPFSDLNSAMKINAGIDIINTLKTYYDVDVPCIIDNAETILKPLYNDGQQIRLRVTNDEVIRIENDD